MKRTKQEGQIRGVLTRKYGSAPYLVQPLIVLGALVSPVLSGTQVANELLDEAAIRFAAGYANGMGLRSREPYRKVDGNIRAFAYTFQTASGRALTDAKLSASLTASDSGIECICCGAAALADDYYTVVVAATEEDPPFILAYPGLPVHIAARPYSRRLAAQFLGTNNVAYIGTVYGPPLHFYLEFTANGRSAFVDPYNGMVFSAIQQITRKASGQRVQQREAERARCIAKEWEDLKIALLTTPFPKNSLACPPPTKLIADVPDYQQNDYGWMDNDCGPTASANILSYYDNHGYPKIADMPGLIAGLKTAMGWNAVKGTSEVMQGPGMVTVANLLGYHFSYDLDWWTSWDKMMANIDRNQPVIYNVFTDIAVGEFYDQNGLWHGCLQWAGGHSTTMVGYNQGACAGYSLPSQNWVIIHDNWECTGVNIWVAHNAIGGGIGDVDTIVLSPAALDGSPGSPDYDGQPGDSPELLARWKSTGGTSGDCLEGCNPDGCIVKDIPAVSEWGLIVMTLLVLTAGTIVLLRSRVMPQRPRSKFMRAAA